MNEHFCAFSFVDRIHGIQPGMRITGSYRIPERVSEFPMALVAEAVGQLAAWAAMATVDFQRRPVAGLAGRMNLLKPVHPGQLLELAAEMETVDVEAAAYRGTAQANGIPVLVLEDCVGPMLPVDLFDDPQALRDRFALLRGQGAVPGVFEGLPVCPLHWKEEEIDQGLSATLHVPVSAPFFADHFPRRPVYPGSLLMHANFAVVTALAARGPAPVDGGRWVIRGAENVKLRVFVKPGEALKIEARWHAVTAEDATVTVRTRKGERLVSSVQVRLAREGCA